MNALTKTTSTAVGFTDPNYDPFAAAAADMGGFRGNFLGHDGNSGDYTYGPAADKKELDLGTQLAVNMTTVGRGWICWVDGEVADETMVNIMEGSPPAASTLADHGPYQKYEDGSEDGWVEQSTVEFRHLETGELFLFKAAGKSKNRAIGNLLADYAKVWKTKPGQVAVIELGDATFEPKVGKEGGPKKKIGKKHAPVFKIVGWISNDEFEELAGVAAAAEKNEADASADTGADDASNYEEQVTESTKVAAAEQTPATTQTAAPTGGARRGKRF